MLKHYIEWLYPGLFVSNIKSSEVPDRSAPAMVPDGAYGYRHFSREEVMQDGEVLAGKNKDYSPTTFYGEIMTLDQVKALPGDNRILISNMQGNGWDRVVKTVRGQFMPLNEGDTVLPPPSSAIAA